MNYSYIHNFINLLNTTRLVYFIFFLKIFIFMELYDFDYFWHLETGKYIVNNFHLPRTDIFSHTNFGKEWVLHEWLFQVKLILTNHYFGKYGINFLVTTFIILSVYFSHLSAKLFTKNNHLAIYLLITIFIIINPYVVPRPQVVSYLFFSIFLYLLLEHKFTNRRNRLFLLPLLMILWVNCHGGYIIGLALISLFVISEVTAALSANNSCFNKKRLSTLIITLLITIICATINPDFISHFKYPFYVIGMEASRTISEWQSPDFHTTNKNVYLLYLFSYMILFSISSNRNKLLDITIPFFFIYLGFVSSRNIPFALLITLPYLSKAYSEIEFKLPVLNASITNKTKLLVSLKKYNIELGSTGNYLNWIILLVATYSFVLIKTNFLYPDRTFDRYLPKNAVDFIVESGLTGNMFNSYNYGGYLIHRLFPDQLVFIDGRADMYGDDFIKEYDIINNALPGWEILLDKYSIEYIVCYRNSPLRQAVLAKGNFSLVFDDTYHSVLIKGINKHREIVNKYSNTADIGKSD